MVSQEIEYYKSTLGIYQKIGSLVKRLFIKEYHHYEQRISGHYKESSRQSHHWVEGYSRRDPDGRWLWKRDGNISSDFNISETRKCTIEEIKEQFDEFYDFDSLKFK